MYYLHLTTVNVFVPPWFLSPGPRAVLDTGCVADDVSPRSRGPKVPQPLQRGAPGTGGHGGVAKDEISYGGHGEATGRASQTRGFCWLWIIYDYLWMI